MVVVNLRGQGEREIREAVRAEVERDTQAGLGGGRLICYDKAGVEIAGFPLLDVLTYRVQ